MSRLDYRRKALLARIHTTIDTFYLRQDIDWNYDIRKILDRILELAVAELEFGEGRRIDRGIMVVRRPSGEALEVGAGWSADSPGDDKDIAFSRTIVDETLQQGKPVLCENARQDPRFQQAESIQRLEVLSLLSVPIESEAGSLGAIYIERRDAAHLFTTEDRDFLCEFATTIAPYIKTALIHQEHVAEIRNLKAALDTGAAMPNIIGRSQAMMKVLDLARIAASAERTVLITGESGSGKELLAQGIHAQSRRSTKPFIVVDCSALSENLLESELFGHRRGSFTGAVADKAGAFEQADGGTIFLDEISDSSKSMQQQLRRVLQEGEIRRVGDNNYRKVDTRVICATNRHLPDEVAEGRFIHDLYHRLHQFPIRIPPLRERKEDIPTLVEHFIASVGSVKNPPVGAIDPDALKLLMRRDWRANNVRELRNVVELAVDLTTSDVVDRAALEHTLEVREESIDGDGFQDAGAPVPTLGSPHVVGVEGDCLFLDPERTRSVFDETLADAAKEDRPYYRMLRELCGKLAVEALRHRDWKLRPAAKLMGISPVKLRTDLRAYLEHLLRNSGPRGQEAVAQMLDMPESLLMRKLRDLGVEAPTTEKPPSGEEEGAA